jgi:putative membrane protein
MMSEFKRQHPIAAITKVLATIKQNFVTIVILLFIGTSNSEGYFLYFLIGGIALTLISGVFSWWMFKYRVHEDELQIRKGVIVKSNMYMSKDRIQVIDITEGVLQRMFGLVQLEVKTAGGGTDTATISAISRGEAEAMRTELRNKRNGNGSSEQDEEFADFEDDREEEIISTWKLSTKDLVFAAFTSGNFGLIASILGAASGQMNEFINEETIEYVYEALPGYNDVTLVIGIIIAILIVSWVLSFLGVIFRYSDFRLEKTSEELIITSGLLERKHITVPFDRIQAVRFIEGLIRQPFGYGMINVESAGFDQTQKGRSIVLVPFIASANVSAFLNEFLEEYDEPEFTIRPPKRTLFRYLRRPNYILVLLIPVVWYLIEYGWLSLLLIPLATYLGWLQYRDAAAGLGERILRMRYRVLSRTTAFIKKKRVQDAESSQNPFQRRKNIHHLKVIAASGAGGLGLEISDLATEDIHEILKWLVGDRSEEKQGEPQSITE